MEIKVMKNIMDANDRLAEENRSLLRDRGITAVNVMGSPGAGKTSVLVGIMKRMQGRVGFSVIEGDIASSIDAQLIDNMGIPVVQINTGGGCHLDAYMIKAVVEEQRSFDNSVMFIENVGNLVCPSSFDLGETCKVVIASVPEGHDKPFKYISMFETADVVVLNKVDLMPYIEFDRKKFYEGLRAVNEKAKVFEVSCRTGEGFEGLVEWIEKMHGK